MAWYQGVYEGELMGKFWERFLLGSERDKENKFLRRFLNYGLVLDVGCGPGNHTAGISLYQPVIGIDLSEYLLKRAREECKKNGNYENVNLIRADMRDLPFRQETFDNIINIISFGFFSDEENEAVFRDIIKLLKKSGVYIHQNYYHPPSERPLEWEKDYLSSPQVPKGFFATKERKYDPKTKRVHIKEVIEDLETGEDVKFEFKNRLFDLVELKQLHARNGLKIKHVFGSFSMEGFDKKKFNLMLIVSEKK